MKHIYIASPDLYEEFYVKKRQDKKYQLTLYKYISRACSRCTPFGLFAGCSVGHWNTSTQMILCPPVKYRKQSKIDSELLCNIIEKLKQDSSENAVSLYPSINLKNAEESNRLAWCYGDLGIGIALLRASMVTNNKLWYEKALEILFYAVHRKEVKQTNIVDACFCHGKTGVAQLFKRAFTYTSKYKFLEANRYWIRKTLEIGQHASKPAGFELFGGIPENVYCLLDGIAGIGLTLLGNVGNNNYSRWDEAFLLS